MAEKKTKKSLTVDFKRRLLQFVAENPKKKKIDIAKKEFNIPPTILRADERLKGTLASEKNEILFSEFNINYNKEPEQFKKGTSLIRKILKCNEGEKPLLVVVALYCDIIKDKFWKDHPEILECKTAGEFSNVNDYLVFSITNKKNNT